MAKKSTEDMIKDALVELADRGGSSLPKIKKFLTDRYSMDFDAGKDKSLVLKTLKRGVEKGVFKQNKASYSVIKVKPAPVAKKPAKKPAKKRTGGGGGGLQAPKTLSPELANLVGTSSLSRPQVVKAVWAYAKGNDCKDGRFIVCDANLKAVFGKPKVDMFEMNKILSSHLS
uniref:DM2 domain-containing protein n=1 Tax=Rhizochromulina marina TaxID=1034831 RepID=A0A7S2SE10_9STRA